MACTWQKEDYFSLLMSGDKRSYTALEMLVDDLHADKEKTVSTFLRHSGSEDFLWGLVRLLGSDTARVAGNAAYILGTMAESEAGCLRVLSLAKDQSADSRRILQDLTRMLTFDDSESVMNAAGTMGTLAESHEGREWMMSEKCLPQTLEHVTALLHSENMWTASNAALVLARLSISEKGCMSILNHEHSQHILSKLILSLGVDEAGRGMNAAFAIGRLCDLDQGRKRLLQLNDSERMISSLAKMLSCEDTGASKNSCFALSCLATNSEGHSRLLSNIHSDDILKTLSALLSAEDSETGWFAAMTMRTLASQPKGCLRLRDHPQVVPALKAVEKKTDVNADLKEEAIITIEILKRLPKPSPPIVQVVSGNSVRASWEPVVTKSGFPVRYQLFDATKCVYTGKECNCSVIGLQPNTAYAYRVRAYTEGDESPFSDAVSILTEESVPGVPQGVRVLGATITQLKIGWDPPECFNGVLKGYHIYLGDKEVQHTMETNVILTGLTANTTYEIYVCAATSKGRGEKAGTVGTTSEIGAHAPSKPHVNVIGRNELYVSWNAPEVPLGRFNRYDVIMNDKIIYSGNDLNLPVRRLTPDSEYCFVVVALTSEGKFESKMTKKRTAKDEYDTARAPLYQAPKKEVTDGAKTPTNLAQLKRKKSAGRISSAKNIVKPRINTAKERAKNSAKSVVEPRPSSAASSIISASDSEIRLAPSLAEPSNPIPPQSSTSPSPVSVKPIAEIKHEIKNDIPAPLSKTKPVRPIARTDRAPISAKLSPPVVLSTVSMQNNKKEEASDDPVFNVNVKKLGGKNERDLPISGNNMRMERSKTTISNRDLRKSKNTLNTQANRAGSETKLMEKSESPLNSADRITHDRSELSRNSIERVRPILGSDKSLDLPKSKGMDAIDLKQDFSVSAALNGDKGRSAGISKDKRSRDGTKTKDAILPKPSLPSQKYLEGFTPVSPADSHKGHRSNPSPRSSKDLSDAQDSDWLTQVKSISETYSRPHLNFSLPTPADSTYYIDSAQYLQRTNTYINSHRYRPIKPFVLKSVNGQRPTGRRALEKLQKSNSKIKVSQPISQSLNFEADIPEPNTSKLGNKFIPMQLRTQPSNLGVGQLQRVNTTLLGDISDNSVAFRRLEALTRSQTQIELKHQQSSAVAVENRRDLGLLMHKDKEKNPPSRKVSSGPPQKVKLTGSGHHHRHKEPDSMLLQQSWGLNNSQDLGALQNVR